MSFSCLSLILAFLDAVTMVEMKRRAYSGEEAGCKYYKQKMTRHLAKYKFSLVSGLIMK